MSTKFEQLLDYLVNEEMDKANELFHEIVVEKSREIYENLIAQQAEEEQEESVEEEQEEQEESVEEAEEEQQESVELEDSYEVEADDDEDEMPVDDPTDDMLGDVEVDSEEEDHDQAVMDIQSAVAELEQALAALGAKPEADEFDADDEDSEDEMPMIGMSKKDEMAFEGRRITREYTEKVGKPSGHDAGAGTGEKMPAPTEGVSPISKGSGKPTTGAKAIQTKSTGANEDGTKPHGKAGGLVKNAQTMNTGNQNVPGGKVSVKSLTKVAKTGNNEGHAVGAGTGENSVKGATNTHSPLAK